MNVCMCVLYVHMLLLVCIHTHILAWRSEEDIKCPALSFYVIPLILMNLASWGSRHACDLCQRRGLLLVYFCRDGTQDFTCVLQIL